MLKYQIKYESWTMLLEVADDIFDMMVKLNNV